MMLNAMIVEDNAIYRYAIKSIIRWEDYGFHIVGEALNGVHALDLLQHHHVDLIVTDISMPEMGGIDLIQKVKQLDASIKMVALSSFDDFRYVKEALKLGAEDYLLKHDLEPSTLQQLLEQMSKKIIADNQKRKQDELRTSSFEEMRGMLGRKLLLGDVQAEEVNDQANAMEFPIHIERSIVILLEGHSESGAYVSKELLNRYSMIVPISKQRSAIITYYPHEKSERKCVEMAQQLASQLYMDTKRHSGSAIIGISDVGIGLKDLALLYKQAESALELFVYEGVEQIYQYSAVKVREATETITRMNVQLQPLIMAMKSGNFEEIQIQTEKLFQTLNVLRPPVSQIKTILTELVLLFKTIAIEKNNFTVEVEQSCKEMRSVLERSNQPLKQLQQQFLHVNRQLTGEASGSPVVRKEIQLAMAYIDEHYAGDITVAQIAEILHLSTNYLSNLFKSETGMRMIEYINRCRIRKAKELLRDSNLKVYEVAERTGFQETSYFCKVFKELEDKTVKDYRRLP
ncbi:response regulator [Paenibacillus qinlingensis]|uniref:YesN/AraC family two-component response regulator n=1 Tax=Paenibacillus qinlingensis TaxID=1837343 RepID=A0ABU1NT08_9BACL|nr:response regulator [Paenibacillus qinlingensis]MDR6550620.1 YesN/AraC family two-component response regulator [Paenibacillus qinlingensis]